MLNARTHLVALTLAAALGSFSCKDDAAPADGGASAASSASAAATAESAASAEADAKPPKGDTDAKESDDPMDDPEVAKAAAKYDCGAKGQEMCPMQKWMKEVMLKAAKSKDAEKLSAALSEAAKKPVEGYDEWVEIATKGAKAAADGDIKGAKKTCKSCHKLYKKQYIKTLRDQPW